MRDLSIFSDAPALELSTRQDLRADNQVYRNLNSDGLNEERIDKLFSDLDLLTRDRGRPTKLTEERSKSIISLIRGGVPIETASRANLIEPATFHNWIRRGAQDYQEDKQTVFLDFFVGVMYAKAQLEAELALKWKKITTEGVRRHTQVWKEKLVEKKITLENGEESVELEKIRWLDSETIDSSGDGDWRGIAEFMLRRMPERWKRVEGIEQTGKDGGPIEVVQHSTLDVDKMSPEARKMLLEEIKLAGNGSSEGVKREEKNERLEDEES